MKVDIHALQERVRELVEEGKLAEAHEFVAAVEAYYRGLLDAEMTRLSRTLAETSFAAGGAAYERAELLRKATVWRDEMTGRPSLVRTEEAKDAEAVAVTKRERVTGGPSNERL